MTETVSEELNRLGLSNAQADRLAALQDAGRKLDFVYHYTDDGTDPRRAASRFDEFRAQLKAFAEQGEITRQFAAALWDHLAPRFVGWRPEFIEGVEARHLTSALVRLDEQIDARLGRTIPPELRAVSRDVRERFDDLLFAYETGTWRDSRTPGDVRDELLFVAFLDEKIRHVLYGAARDVDVRKTIEDHRPARDGANEHFAEAAFEAKAYQAQLAKVSDLLDRLHTAGVKIYSGLEFAAGSEEVTSRTVNTARMAKPARHAPSDKNIQGVTTASRHPATDAETYWRNVARSASAGGALDQSRSLNLTARRGRGM